MQSSKLANRYVKDLARNHSERALKSTDYKMVESDHIPYDALQLEMMRRLKEKEGIEWDLMLA